MGKPGGSKRNKFKDKKIEKMSCKIKRRFRDLAEVKAARARIPTKGYHLTSQL